jgi:hypothetical protein
MLGALALNIVSQFLLYDNDGGRGDGYMVGGWMPGQVASGWTLHGWMAFIPVVLLVIYFMDSIVLTAAFRAVGWWITVVALIAATIDGHPFFDGATGAKLGWLTVLAAIVAAWMNMRAQRTAAAPTAPVTPPTTKKT